MITIFRASAEPRKNQRNMCVAYSLTWWCYASMGVLTNLCPPMGDIAALGSDAAKTSFLSLQQPTEMANFLIVARLAVLVQSVTVYPVLLFIVRSQVPRGSSHPRCVPQSATTPKEVNLRSDPTAVVFRVLQKSVPWASARLSTFALHGGHHDKPRHRACAHLRRAAIRRRCWSYDLLLWTTCTYPWQGRASPTFHCRIADQLNPSTTPRSRFSASS